MTVIGSSTPLVAGPISTRLNMVLPLEPLFLQPLTMTPGPLGFLRKTMETELIAVVVMLTPAIQFPFLLNVALLPMTFLHQSFLV